jgi:iron complex transport system ATP-binding protein
LLLMGDGSWDAGPIGEVMTAPALSRYLGHPIEIVMHGGRRIFVPVQPGA